MTTNYTTSENPFNTIDVHIHPLSSIISTETIISEMDRGGISKAVLLALDLDHEMLNDTKLRNEIIEDIYAFSLFIDPEQIIDAMSKIIQTGRTTNEHVASLVKEHPDRFIGFGSVNPAKSKQYVKSVLKEIEDLGLKGIKLIPTLQFFNPSKNKNLKLIFKFASKRNYPVLIHTGRDPGPFEIRTLRCVKNTHPKNWTKFVRKTKTPIIFAHLGGYGMHKDASWLDTVLEFAKNNPNIYLDTSAATFTLEDPEIVSKIRQIGFKQILFGSDSPVVLGTSMKHSKKTILRNSLLSEEEKRWILYENAFRIFSDEFSSEKI